jgi:hypothetical protein
LAGSQGLSSIELISQSVIILLALIVDIRPLFPVELNEFIKWKTMRTGDRDIESKGDANTTKETSDSRL